MNELDLEAAPAAPLAEILRLKTLDVVVGQRPLLGPPAHILNAPTKLMKQHGYGAGYSYDHDDLDGFSGQNCFPDGMDRQIVISRLNAAMSVKLANGLTIGSGYGQANSRRLKPAKKLMRANWQVRQ